MSNHGETVQYNAADFDAAAPGIIATERFGTLSLQGIKDGDWITFQNVDITNLDSLALQLSVARGGTLEIRVGAVTGNMIASTVVESGGTGGRSFGSMATLRSCEYTGASPVSRIYSFFSESQADLFG